MVHVTNRANVNVWLGTLKLAFCHFFTPKNKARVRFSVCTRLLNHLARVTRWHFVADERPKALGRIKSIRNTLRNLSSLVYLAREATIASATLRGASV